ncbi:hypothetical protein FNF28_05953 [Cafeteria roenbergensis]|uniref:BTB domain-containing protein n=1 Tax=Cafeteria roenbergensis TaxID=33653 RepID=A0A5A8D3K4_CAFRO|nr:hypothetical protein FNF28_05953 [Cafeteria roenbergensis]
MAAAAASSMSAAAAAAAGPGEDGKPTESTVAKPKAAVEFFRRLLNDQVTADLEIVVAGGGKFLAHRAVLAARSDELRELLAGTVSEPRATLKFPKDDARCWAQILRFAYTNEWDYDSSNVVMLRRIAEDRGFADFEEVVAAAISKVFLKSSARALDVALGAAREGDDGMMEAAFAACYRNPLSAMFSDAFLELDADMLASFASDDRATANETNLFRAMLRWAEIALEKEGGGQRRPDVPARASAKSRWAEWLKDGVKDADIPFTLPLTYSGAAIRTKLGDAIRAVRFPLMDGRLLAEEVLLTEVLTDEELADVLAFSVTPKADRDALDELAGFSAVKRTPIEKELRISMWGGGGASGKYGNSGAGGAGGLLRVKYSLRPGETLMFYVGEGGHADKGSSERTTQAWPNSGRGGYNWKSGSGGGATYFTSDRFGDDVVAGAGGGGGGSAGQSWSSGGGGGGGTKNGKVGEGGDAVVSGSNPNKDGKNGNGNGGTGDSGGERKTGRHAHGAGGSAGSGGTRSNGGDGGESSCKHAKVDLRVAARSKDAVVDPSTGASYGAGASSGDKKRGSHGGVIIVDTSTGKRTVLTFSKREPIPYSFS